MRGKEGKTEEKHKSWNSRERLKMENATYPDPVSNCILSK